MNEVKSPYRPLIIFGMMMVDALIIFDAFSIAYLLRFKFHLFAYTFLQPASVDEYLKAMVVVAYFWILLFYLFGLYDYTRHRAGIDTVHSVFKAVSFGTLIILSLTYFYREFSFSRLVCVYAWAISIILFVIFRLSINFFQSELYQRGKNIRTVAVVGSRTLARYLIEKVKMQPELGYRIVGVLDTVTPEESIPECEYLGNVQDLKQIISNHKIQGIFIAHPTLGHYNLLEVIHVCESKGITIRMIPPTYDLLINYRDLEEIDGVPLVKVNEQEYRQFDDLVKRGMDLTLSTVILLLSLPLWAIIAIWIKLEDGGSIFFGQIRTGKNGQPFQMWKFRTMIPDAEMLLKGLVDVTTLDEPVFKLEDDPRITRTGYFLRKTSLDELPQLINVILGHMSLVGPRPEDEKLVRLYNVWERRRLKALPGISGLQQVKCRGSDSLSERVKWDILYVRKRSLILDMWIILRTVWVVISGKGAR